MSVIQKIQEKYAKLMAIIIALALIIFVVMLAFENGGALFGSGGSDTVGNINGEKIDYASFRKKADDMEEYMSRQGYPAGAALQQQAINQAWEQEINRVLMSDEFNKLGMQIGKKEIGDILYGDNPPQDLKQGFTDPATGVYNAQAAKQQIDQMLKKGTQEQKAQVNSYISSLEQSRLAEKYSALLTNSLNTPRWFVEKQNAEKSQLAKISLVREFYAQVPDSTVKVTDQEITEYINKHKDDFKQEESRSIAYVSFSALPTGADSLAAIQKLDEQRSAFQTAPDIEQYLESQGVQNFYNGYINDSTIQVPFKDSIFKTPVGEVYGPYIDGNSYSLARVLGKRTQPDSVSVRHILIGTSTQDPQTREMVATRDTATAYALTDSIMKAIAGGANFDTLCLKYSDDGTKTTGGKYPSVSSARMVPPFNDFIFGNPVGSKGIVKTEFGYHYVEITSAKGLAQAYKVAYITLPIEASQETDQSASNKASQFAGSSRNQEAFDKSAEKLKASGINKVIAPNITPTAYQINGLGISRPFVRAIYEAKKGEVMQPERVGENWIVAIVTEINDKGTRSAASARTQVEPLLLKKKKAELLTKKIGTVTTLEAAATALGGKQIEVADSVRMLGLRPPLLSQEPKVIGAAFNPANRGKIITQVIPGQDAVYVVRVDAVNATSVMEGSIDEQRKNLTMMTKQTLMPPQTALRESADIKDNRKKFF